MKNKNKNNRSKNHPIRIASILATEIERENENDYIMYNLKF